MQNLRILDVAVTSSTTIDVTFTSELVNNLVASNVKIISESLNVPDSTVLGVKVNKNLLTITCQPLTPLSVYYIELYSQANHSFTSLHGDAIISEDGISNRYLITGPISSDNPVNNYLKSYLHDNIYNVDDSNTLVSKYISSLAIILSRALYDIKQSINENYLSNTIVDEQRIRGDGPFDRLNEESAYEILRVGRTPSDTKVSNTDSYDPFDSSPITLQKQSNVETLTTDSSDTIGKFNINNLVLNLSNSPVTKLTGLTFLLSTVSPNYTYDIASLGYQIQNSRYDQSYASTYVTLENNQIRLNDKILDDELFSINNIIRIEVNYESKDLGRVIDDATVQAYTYLTSTREVLPPIINIFNLKHAPIVNSSNETAILGGVTFIDANSSGSHAAFVTEIPFRLNGLPSIPGQYSVDYTTGTVYVYGSSISRDGTGPYPPVATYRYKYTYKTELDYVYDSGFRELVALPLGSLINYAGTIEYKFEKVLIPNIDYIANLHTEVLTERVGSRQVALNAFKTEFSPITNVFRIYNETTGELYSLNRWNDDKIYYAYNTPPSVVAKTDERVTFNNVTNELLFVESSETNISLLKVAKIVLQNSIIVASSEDTIGSSLNSSLFFSNTDIFATELWYNRSDTVSNNIDRLLNVGDYIVDYYNGIIYCALSATQGSGIGNATYKNNNIIPQNPHIISVEDLFYRINPLTNKDKIFSYTSFGEGFIIPEVLEYSDETVLNNSSDVYQLYNTNVGAFVDTSFVSGVSNQVKFVRSIFEYSDLLNNSHPINFAEASLFSGFGITVDTISKQSFDNIKFDGYNYYVTLNENFSYSSANITYTISIIRTSDLVQLWDGSGIITPGDPVKLTLSGIGSPVLGDLVQINYEFTINDLSRIIVDYNRGELYTDYTYVSDEIIVSYEYGDNLLDFRQTATVPAGSTYYVSYKVGALRDALLKNFGNLINIDELKNFDIEFDRERYRDALTAALSSFIKGPTLSAIKNIGNTISHIEPIVTESAFQDWILGSSLLSPEQVTTSGTFDLLSAKFGLGVLVNSDSQSITFPVNSNIRLEEGTFEEWVIPQWNGIDNNASLSFTILRGGLAIDPLKIFIGSTEDHPDSNTFSIDKSISYGIPNMNKDGVYIYYAADGYADFDRWYLKVIDGYVGASSSYKITMITDGTIYDSKCLITPTPTNVSILTRINSITLNITATTYIDQGITFISDLEHYLFDFGKDKSNSRLSIYKDASGYLNFRVFDKEGSSYHISSDVSSWQLGDPHFVAASWKIGTINGRDEMHLFIDGQEVPNIIKYGQNLAPYLHEKYRTINPEEIIGIINKDIIASVDLVTTAGNTTVSSAINFGAYNISPGDTIFIDVEGFSTLGYTISSVAGQSLILSTIMPLTITSGSFSVNRTTIAVTSEIDISSNIVVSTISSILSGTDLSTISGSATITASSTDFDLTNIQAGYSIRIDDPGLLDIYTILQVSGNTLVLSDNVSLSLTNVSYYIYPNDAEVEIPGVRALRPSYSIERTNTLILSNSISTNDIVLIKTLGLNFRKTKRQYYVWADGYENMLMTKMAPPIYLDSANVTKIIFSSTGIGPLNSTLSLGIFTSSNLLTYQPIISSAGRSLSVTISGNNTDFTSAVQVTIDGYIDVTPISEIISFTDYGTSNSINKYTLINFINVIATPIITTKNALALTIKEQYPVTYNELSDISAILQYSYAINTGYNLSSSGSTTVTDGYKLFSNIVNNNYLLISSPPVAAGYYQITEVSADRGSLILSTSVPAFTGGTYQIFNVSEYRSGLQNGFFTFERDGYPGTPYYLTSGFYEVEYYSYLNIRMEPINNHAHLGHDMFGANNAGCIIDGTYLYSVMLTDTRVGETIPVNEKSITKNYNSIKRVKKDQHTLMLLDFEIFPFENDADHYVRIGEIKNQFESSRVVNENFGNSLVLLDKPIILSNDGILDTRKEGTIEFWTSPLFDTGNDPNNRFYFDAYSAVTVDSISTNNTSVKLNAPASSILKVVLKGGDPAVDYFAGGKLEIDTQNAIQESQTSVSNSMAIISQPALQIISVKIVGDATDRDFFGSGTLGSDRKTIYLGNILPGSSLPLIITYQPAASKSNKLNTQVIRLNKKLPNQNSHVQITYLPKGVQGDRISIYKDTYGFINFGISASGKDFVVRAPTRWVKDSWHRVMASYKINGGLGQDEMRLFVDGYEYTNTTIGSSILFGDFPIVLGSSVTSDGYFITDNIRFKDSINQLVIGAQYNKQYPIFNLLDNFRISNISRPVYSPYGEPIDINYSNNLSVAFPVTPDLYTTYLLDFSESLVKAEEFTVLKNRENGNFDFSINILDSFGIVSSSLKVQEVLEKLIKTLKPANSRVFISYTK